MLIDASAYAVSGVSAARGAEWIHHQLRSTTAPLGAGIDPEATVPAYVNHGRWVVNCPDCRNAQLACKTDRRFMCNECGNIAVGHKWRPVVWPADAERIANLLENRPREVQNWNPGEDVRLLAIENLENTGKIK
jgi:hypothetical protein